MPKPQRKTLDIALQRIVPEAEPVAADPAPAASPSPAPTPPAQSKKTRNNRAPKLSVYLSDEVHRQLREIAHVEYPTKLNDLLLEGIDRVFKDRGRPSIAELNKEAG